MPVIGAAEFRHLTASKPDLADVIVRLTRARRESLRSGEGAVAVRIIGSRYSAEALALRAVASPSRLQHTWIDLEEVDDPEVPFASLGLRARDTPAVMTPSGVLRHPTPGKFAQHLGLTITATPGYICDLVVVGNGPAGFATAVYGPRRASTPCPCPPTRSRPAARRPRARAPRTMSASPMTSQSRTGVLRRVVRTAPGGRASAACEVVGLQSHRGFQVLFLASRSDRGTKWAPRYIRITSIPVGAINKIDKSVLRRERWNTTDPVYWKRDRHAGYRAFTADDLRALAERFSEHGRSPSRP